jgi:hypothetical protein
MADRPTNKLPWAEVVGGISASDTQRARTAQRFFENRRFAKSRNLAKRGLIRRLMNTVFDRNLLIIEIFQKVVAEIRENSDAKALNSCVYKIEELGQEGWRRANTEGSGIRLHSVELEIQLQPDALLENDLGDHLLLYAYFRQSPPLSTDAIRGLLYLVRQSGKEPIYENARIVVLDCYNDRSYEASDFQEGEPWIAKQMTKVLSTYNVSYRVHLDGNPPGATSVGTLPRRSRGARAGGAAFSVVPIQNQLCLQFG